MKKAEGHQDEDNATSPDQSSSNSNSDAMIDSSFDTIFTTPLTIADFENLNTSTPVVVKSEPQVNKAANDQTPSPSDTPHSSNPAPSSTFKTSDPRTRPSEKVAGKRRYVSPSVIPNASPVSPGSDYMSHDSSDSADSDALLFLNVVSKFRDQRKRELAAEAAAKVRSRSEFLSFHS